MTESRRTLTSIVRKVVFAGLTILGAWLFLLGLRGISVDAVISNPPTGPLGADAAQVLASHWSSSWWTGKPVSELVLQRIGIPLQLAAYGALMALGIAAVLIALGLLITRITKSPPWLVKTRTVLRLVLVSGVVSNPFVLGIIPVMLGVLAFFGILPAASSASSHGISVSDVFLVSLLPAWLLIQAGHQELGSVTDAAGRVVRHLAVTLMIRLLRLTGAVIAVAVLLARTGFNSVYQRDFPVVFAFAFALAVMVVLAKLVADIMEILYRRRRASAVGAPQPETDMPPRLGIPTGWVVFALALVTVFVLAAIIGPLLAPYGVNQINIADKLARPSAAHLLGTDNLGRDMLSRVLVGLRTDVFSGLLAVIILVGVAVGWVLLFALARKRNDWLGDTLADVVLLPRDVVGAFPWLVLLMVLVSLAGGDTTTLVFMVSIVLLPHVISMLRECYLPALGKQGRVEDLLRGVLPVFILATGAAILYMAALGYLGMGVPPPQPELGSMLSGAGMANMIQAPWIAQWPIIVLALLLLVWVLAGNALLERLGFRSGTVWAKSLE